MLSHCANPQCLKPFLRLRQGKLFLVETECVAQPGDLPSPAAPQLRRQPRHVERYWLCDRCAEVWTLVYELRRGVVLMPLLRPAGAVRVTMAKEYRESA